MKFTVRKRRQAPAVIIISLIDILIVLLIFLMVTTTFKQHPAVKIALPESRQARTGEADQRKTVVVSIAKTEPYYYVDQHPVTLSRLQEELLRRAAQNPNVQLSVRADEGALFVQVMKVLDAANSAKIKNVVALTKQGPAK
jgi:biopolymer transport protein ExbD